MMEKTLLEQLVSTEVIADFPYAQFVFTLSLYLYSTPRLPVPDLRIAARWML